MKESYFENEYAEFWMREGIIGYTLKPHIKVITLEIAKKVVSDRLKISGGIKHSLFVDLGNAMAIDKISRKYFAENETIKYLNATAILVNNPTAKLGANIYIHIDKPAIPTRFFTDKSLALAWLEKYKV